MNDSSHGYTLGADLYISSTAGQLTTTKPTGEANLIQKIGKVVSQNHYVVGQEERKCLRNQRMENLKLI